MPNLTPSESKHYDMYGQYMSKEGNLPCGCPVKELWYDVTIGLWRCASCEWCSN